MDLAIAIVIALLFRVLFFSYRGVPTRSPWPYDIKIGSDVFMLGHKDPQSANGPLYMVSGETEPERTARWDDWSGGFGERFRVEGANRYMFAFGVDASIGGMLQLGPAVSSVTPATTDSTNGGTHFFEMGGILFALMGRYCLYRVADGTWSVSKDFGSGKCALDVVVATPNSGSTTYAYVAMGDGEHIWRYDGSSATTTWSQHASLDALCFAIVGRELWRGHDTNAASKVDLASDPWTAANWTSDNSFRIGDKTQRLVRMCPNAAGTLAFFKRDSIHVLDADGEDVPLYTGIKFTPSAENGRYTTTTALWENNLYTTYNGVFYAIGPAMELQPVGPEKQAAPFDSTFNGGIKGHVTAVCGTPYGLYAGVANDDSSASWLMKLGAYPNGATERLDVWHGSLTQPFSSVIIMAMGISDIGAATNHRRMWMILSDGSLRYFTLPCVPNPDGCDSYGYPKSTDVDSANIYFSETDFGFPEKTKHLHSLTIGGRVLSTSGAAGVGNPRAVAYLRDEVSGVSASYGAQSPSSDYDTTPAKAQDYATDTTREGIALAVGLRQTSNAGQFTCPIVTSVSLDYELRPKLQLVYEFYVIVEDRVQNRIGHRMDRAATTTRTLLKTARNTMGSMTVILPDHTTVELAIDGYEETQAWDHRGLQWRSAVKLRGTASAKSNYTLGS